jgi:hypothetical protein
MCRLATGDTGDQQFAFLVVGDRKCGRVEPEAVLSSCTRGNGLPRKEPALLDGRTIIVRTLRQTKKRQVLKGNLPLLFSRTGEPSRARTCDPLIKSQLLYQLSYRPDARGKIIRAQT